MTELEEWFFRYNGWSFSRHNLMNFCNRAYYYRYIYPARKDIKLLEKEKIRRLKSLNSLYVIQGSLIHETIENQIGQHYLKRPLNKESAIGQYVQGLKRYNDTASDTILECFNGKKLDVSFFEALKTSGLTMLDNFFDIVWPNFKDLEYLRHEKFDAFKIQDLTINLKIDYLTKSKGEVIVVSDWKTGKENTYGGVTELQMATYILWVMSHYQKPPEEIRGEFIYLSSGKMRPFQMGFDQLEKIKNFIVEDSTKLNKSYEFSNFTTDPSKEKCHSCQFGSICSDSKITEDKDQSMLDQDDNLKELLADIE